MALGPAYYKPISPVTLGEKANGNEERERDFWEGAHVFCALGMSTMD